jgi:N4-gp56 family major capsid protein
VDLEKAAMTGGSVKDNPIFTGALGMYNGTILHASNRVPSVVASTRRAIFCGAQACGMAFGRDNGPDRFSWIEELFDYGNQLGVSGGAIFGMKKMQFNSADFATIVASTWAAAHTTS